MTTYTCTYEASMGTITAAARDDALVGLWFNGQKYFPAATDTWQHEPDHPVLADLCAWLDSYFMGTRPPFTGKLAPVGSAFRQEVWQELLRIPYGATTTYGTIAKEIAKRRNIPRFSAQAVGGAVGHNPISIVIPCHRVMGTDGTLTGYAGGLDKKQALLTLEGALG